MDLNSGNRWESKNHYPGFK